MKTADIDSMDVRRKPETTMQFQMEIIGQVQSSSGPLGFALVDAGSVEARWPAFWA
jgi:hypothetical protein